jgi:dehydrogenase/reductase SDR family protein 7B
LEHKVCLITGATSGIGLALAVKFGQSGYRIAITGRSQEKLDSTVKSLKKSGIEILGITADAASETDQRKAVAQTINQYGRLDVLINNAGISMRALFAEVDLEVIRKVMETNFFGTVYATKAALPYLLRSKGSVVGISSIAGYKGLPGRTGYSASKFAMAGFLESLELEMLKKGVHVLLASPGFTATAIRENSLTKTGAPQGISPRDEEKMMQPEEVARQIFEAVEKRKRSLIMTSEGKLMVFLNKFFPAWVSKMVYKKMAAEPNSGLEL